MRHEKKLPQEHDVAEYEKRIKYTSPAKNTMASGAWAMFADGKALHDTAVITSVPPSLGRRAA